MWRSSAARRCRLVASTSSAEIGPGWSMRFTAAASGQAASCWHDISLRTGSGTFNYVNEIPKGRREKLEMSPKLPFNPIVQDVVKKTGAPRFFTYGDIPFNYGFLPQTWEDPTAVDAATGCRGDGDPVDVVEIGRGAPLEIGAVLPVRVLGALGLIDEGETDWKLLCVRASDASSSHELLTPEAIAAVIHWFRFYKTTDGKPENVFALGGELQSATFALTLVEELHEQYMALLTGKTGNPGLWLRP